MEVLGTLRRRGHESVDWSAACLGGLFALLPRSFLRTFTFHFTSAFRAPQAKLWGLLGTAVGLGWGTDDGMEDGYGMVLAFHWHPAPGIRRCRW